MCASVEVEEEEAKGGRGSTTTHNLDLPKSDISFSRKGKGALLEVQYRVPEQSTHR
jgi:hypothetical protein